jgi:hypothetical protein
MEKMRLFTSVLAMTAMLFAATTASAVEFSVVGANSIDLAVGESVEISINVDNASATGVNGLGASVWDYDEAVAGFTSGVASRSFFVQFCGAPNNCFGGVDQAANAFFDRLALRESSIGTSGNRVTIVNAAALSPSSATGALDQGWDGTTGTPDIVVVFTATGLGSTTLQIGTGYTGDGVVLGDGSLIQADGATFTINVIPEPGTALLMGLGLAGLAVAGRRE